MKSGKVILATLVIFCSGLMTGAMLVNKFGRTERARPNHNTVSPAASVLPPSNQQQQKDFLRRMDRELKLSAEQRERMEKILKQSQERTKKIRDQIAPELKEELKKVRSEMRAELSPEQQKKFDEVIKPKLPHNKGGKPFRPEATNAPPPAAQP